MALHVFFQVARAGYRVVAEMADFGVRRSKPGFPSVRGVGGLFDQVGDCLGGFEGFGFGEEDFVGPFVCWGVVCVRGIAGAG